MTAPAPDDDTPMLLLTQVPDDDVAERLARALVDERLAACVTALAPAVSTYRWQGVVEQAREIPLLIKTRAGRYRQIEQRLKALHPYDVPELLAVPVAAGWPAYLQWLRDETRDPD